MRSVVAVVLFCATSAFAQPYHFYSGDDLYEPAIVSVTLSAVRHRAAP